MARELLPEWIQQFWTDSPTEYTRQDIFHLEPDSEVAVFLKYLMLNGFATLTIKVNGANLGTFNGSEPTEIDISVPVITYGTEMPNGGNPGDFYMRYLT